MVRCILSFRNETYWYSDQKNPTLSATDTNIWRKICYAVPSAIHSLLKGFEYIWSTPTKNLNKRCLEPTYFDNDVIV